MPPRNVGFARSLGRHLAGYVSAAVILYVCLRRTRPKTEREVKTADESWAIRGEIFRNSYSEVLAALKHQDDKLGRALTAVAFLTAAGVALYTQIGRSSELTFDGQTLRVTEFFFIAFLVSIVLALGFILAAIGPSTAYRGESKPRTSPGSLLFYASIRGDNEWDSYIDHGTARLQERLARNFHKEAHVISQRVNYKVARSREAGAFIYLAVLSLTLLGIFSMPSMTSLTLWWIASGVLITIAILPLWDRRQMKKFKFPEGRPHEATYWSLRFAILAGITLLILAPSHDGQWAAVVYALALVLISRLAYVRSDFAQLLGPLVAAGIVLQAWMLM